MHSQRQSEEETERNGSLSLWCSVRRPRADGVASRPFPSDETRVNGHRRLEELSSTLDGPMFLKMLVAGIELIELRS